MKVHEKETFSLFTTIETGKSMYKIPILHSYDIESITSQNQNPDDKCNY